MTTTTIGSILPECEMVEGNKEYKLFRKNGENVVATMRLDNKSHIIMSNAPATTVTSLDEAADIIAEQLCNGVGTSLWHRVRKHLAEVL